MKILIVEDDPQLSELLQDHLVKYGYEVSAAEDFSDLLGEFQRVGPDLILMDVNLPYFDGFYWTKKIREHSRIPIIFLSARDHPMDQVLALEYGGDDYLVKPFAYEILTAKIKSQLRRVYGEYANQQERILSFHALSYYPERLEIHYGGQKELLTKREGEIMELLIEQAPKILQRERFLLKLWDDESFVDDNTLSVNMGRLRKKLSGLGLPNLIKTFRNQGYQLDWGDQ